MRRRRQVVLAVVAVVVALAVVVVVVRATGSDDEPPTREQRVRALAGVADLRAVGDSSRVVLTFDRESSAGQVRRALATTVTALRRGEQWFVGRSPVRAGRIPARALLVDRDSDPADLARLLLAVDALPPEVSSVSTFNGAALPTELSVGTGGDLVAVAADTLRTLDESVAGPLVDRLVVSPADATATGVDGVEVRCERDVTRAGAVVDALADTADATGATVRSARVRDCDRLSAVDVEVAGADEAVAVRRRFEAGPDPVDVTLTLGDLSVYGDADPRRAIALGRALARLGATSVRVRSTLDYVQAGTPDPQTLTTVLDRVATVEAPADAAVRLTVDGRGQLVAGPLQSVARNSRWLGRMDRAGYSVNVDESGGRFGVSVVGRELEGGGPLPRTQPDDPAVRERLVGLLRDVDLPGSVMFALADYGAGTNAALVFMSTTTGPARQDDLRSRPSADGTALLRVWDAGATG